MLETRVEFDADMIESMTQKITQLSNSLTLEEADEELLTEIKDLQEKTMLLRENIIDKQRTVSGMLRSEFMPSDLHPKLTIIIKDINSLIEHVKFSFDRLDYLQDTFWICKYRTKQNNKNIYHCFCYLHAPTLIASVYGMNFSFMPELSAKYGYPISIGLMIFSSLIILYFFKKKGWL